MRSVPIACLKRRCPPHHVILSKLPLVRFCQPTEANEVRYWFELLGSNHVTFAICNLNGRVLAAIDLNSERGITSRSLQIKQSVLGVCRVRYLRCPIDKLPSAVELEMLVPVRNSSARGPQAASIPGYPTPAKPKLDSATARRVAHASQHRRWQDSAIFQDSFFSAHSKLASVASRAPPATQRGIAPYGRSTFHNSRSFSEALGSESDYPLEAPNDIVGLVVDSPRYGDCPPR